MPLSEHEQRVLDEIESGLYADDPKFASTVRRNSSGPRAGAGMWKFVFVGLVGVILLVLGLAFGPKPGGFPVVSLLGFLVMFGAGVAALLQPRRTRRSTVGKDGQAGRVGPTSGARRPDTGSRKSSPAGGSFTERMEDRFRRRFEGPR